jgi:hypothetical protein
MNLDLLSAALVGVALGTALASIPFFGRLREDRRILQLVKAGSITHNEARELRQEWNKRPWLCRWFGHAMRLPPGMYVFGQEYTMRCKRCGYEEEYDDFWIERS